MEVLALNTSRRKGTKKRPVEQVTLIANHGIEGDAHAGDWHRQISFLGSKCIEDFNSKGAKVTPGAFGENIIVRDVDFTKLPIGTLVKCNEIEMEITQIGKECHDRCVIYYQMGDCIMPRNGVFAVVNQGGILNVGDQVEIIEPQNV